MDLTNRKPPRTEQLLFLPIWSIVLACLFVAVLSIWTYLVAVGRNPLPFPDRGSRIFSTPSPEAKDAIVALLARYGIRERFQANSSGILRSIMWDGTIINQAPPDVLTKLGHASASIGLVAADPEASAKDAAEFLRSRGFEAHVVLDAEPALPIAFVVTNATSGTVLNFRKHLIHMPRP
ncbi:MAG TPA: hypothetical protein VFZ65_23795 [Planctomycetota bacterium]|nr:hypothetical protein [Planctomycetota bacterium]